MTGVWQRFGKFNLVGAIGATLQLLLFTLLQRGLHWSAEVAAVFAVEIAVLHNFAWHERFTWSDRGLRDLRRRIVRLGRFHVGNGLVSLVGNAVLTHVLVDWLQAPAVPSAMAAIALCAPANFLLANRWVYAR